MFFIYFVVHVSLPLFIMSVKLDHVAGSTMFREFLLVDVTVSCLTGLIKKLRGRI